MTKHNPVFTWSIIVALGGFLFPVVAEQTNNGGGHAFAFFAIMMLA